MDNYMIELNLFIKVRVSHQRPHSWEAFEEGYEIIKNILEKDERIRQVSTEGIHSIEVDKSGGVAHEGEQIV